MSRASVWILALALVCSLASPPRPASEPPHINAIPSSETDSHAGDPPVDAEVEPDDPGVDSGAVTHPPEVDHQPETEAETPSGVDLPSETETEPPSKIATKRIPVTKPPLTDIGFSSTVCTLDGDNHTTQMAAGSGGGAGPDGDSSDAINHEPDESDTGVIDDLYEDTSESFANSTESSAPEPPAPTTKPYVPPPSLEPAPFYVDDS